ncbi:sugar phosphate isomerase/epimerase family protein [Ruania alba]|uniref:sugar phosphate isomerase/epimerase family protein n=1 Tax=Ruania alba TaxID=648782 RepID=UPI002481F80D|nr:TIM barrel protein [Ruania alba]
MDSGLECIEWGGDVHVHPGDTRSAQRAAQLSDAAGLRVASYGSYFRAGDDSPEEFDRVLNTAEALGAPRIRVWAGAHGSRSTSPQGRQSVVDTLQRASDAAAARDVELALEFHSDTLADEARSTVSLLADVGRANLTSYWQPPVGLAGEQALAQLQHLGTLISCVHVFSWWPESERRALSHRRALWEAAIAHLRAGHRDVDTLLEFVVDDDPANVRADAETLRSML